MSPAGFVSDGIAMVRITASRALTFSSAILNLLDAS
jgi:hypothetical protein